MWWGTKDQELTKMLNYLDPLPRAPMTSLHITEASQRLISSCTMLKHQKIRSQLGNPLSDTELSSFTKPFVPESTQKNTRWCVKVFNDWATERNTHLGIEKVPIGFFGASRLCL